MLDAVVAARAQIIFATRPFTRIAARVADQNATRTDSRVADRHNTCAVDRPDVCATCSAEAQVDVLDELFASPLADFSAAPDSVRLLGDADSAATVRADTPDAECVDSSAAATADRLAVYANVRIAFWAVVVVTPYIDACGDTGAGVTAAYSIAASADSFAVVTVATTAAYSAICVDVFPTRRVEFSSAFRDVTPDTVRIVTVLC